MGRRISALRSIFALPLLVAEREGFFAREGLNFVHGADPRRRREADRGAARRHRRHDPCRHAFLIQAAMKGSDAVAIVAEFNNPIYSLIAKPEIKTYADLKGKLLGFAAETGSITISIRKLMAMNGLQRDDYRTKFVDGTPDRLVLPHRRRLRRGSARPAAGFRRHAAGLSAARPLDRSGARIRLHGDGGAPLLGREQQGRGRCASCARSPPRSASSAIRRGATTSSRTIVETTGFAEANARLTLSLYFEPERNVLPRQGEIDLKGLQTAIEFMGEAGVLKPPLPPAGALRRPAISARGGPAVTDLLSCAVRQLCSPSLTLLSVVAVEFRSKLVATERPFALGLERMPRCDVVRQQRQ